MISTHPDDARALYARWMEMWNGDLDAADAIFAEDSVAWPAPQSTGAPPVHKGPDEMRRFVEMGRAIFASVTFRAEDDPIVEGNRLAARWVAEGTYGGGMPGATAEPGTAIVFRGIDVWRVENGRVVEYRVSSDGLHLMAQLGVS